MTAKEMLDSVRACNTRVDTLLRKKRKLLELSSRDEPLREDPAAQNALLEQEIAEAYRELSLTTIRVSRLIERLPLFEERETLQLRYIRLVRYPDIAEILGYCERQIFRIHSRAIKRLETLVAGETPRV